MLPKKHRLKTKTDFQRVYNTGRKIRSPYYLFIISGQKKDKLPNIFALPRFGFVASAKVGKAAKRNNAKRKLREITRIELPKLKSDFEAVFICYSTIVDADIEDVRSITKKIFKEQKLYIQGQ